MVPDDESTTTLYNGSTVPVIVLRADEPSLTEGRTVKSDRVIQTVLCPGSVLNRPVAALEEFLDRAGDERFLAKAAGFRVDLKQTGAGQVLYRGMMGALGYSRNKDPFLELAERLRLATLEAVAEESTSDEECLHRLQARLLGAAGLLPSQRGGACHRETPAHRYVRDVEKLWSLYHHGYEMAPGAWHLSCTRPYNSPLRRLVAMSYLVTRYRHNGLLSGLLDNFAGGAASCRDWRRLEEGLTVTADNYWACHFDFGVSSPAASPTILGKGRVSDIIVNVLLPFTFARGDSDCGPELANVAMAMYRKYPKLSDNALVRHMTSQLGIRPCTVNSARRQQGLLHIYRTLCTQGRCDCCCQ